MDTKPKKEYYTPITESGIAERRIHATATTGGNITVDLSHPDVATVFKYPTRVQMWCDDQILFGKEGDDLSSTADGLTTKPGCVLPSAVAEGLQYPWDADKMDLRAVNTDAPVIINVFYDTFRAV